MWYLVLEEAELAGHIVTPLHLRHTPYTCHTMNCTAMLRRSQEGSSGPLPLPLVLLCTRRLCAFLNASYNATLNSPHLIGECTLEGRLVGVQVLELQEPNLTQDSDGVVCRLGWHHQLRSGQHRSGQLPYEQGVQRPSHKRCFAPA